MNHIVLVNIENDTERVRRQFSPPFGMLIAASVLIRKGIDVVVRHIINTKESLDELSAICKNSLAVGFSTMTSPNLLSAIEASKRLHNEGNFIYWGGTHASLLPELVLKENYVDVVLRGEAECNLYEFYQWRLGRLKANDVSGLCYKDKGGIIIRPLPPLATLNQLGHHPFELLDINKYIDKPIIERKNYIPGRLLPFMTSKGCVKRCAFCYNTVINRSKWRPYPLSSVYKEMDFLIEHYGITGWIFYDDNMFVDPERAWTIIEKYKMPSSVELDLNRVNESMIERALRSNVSKLYIGIESGSDIMLKKMHKGISVKQVREKMKLCHDMGIKVDLSFMILLPDESPEDLEATLSLTRELNEYSNIKIDGPKCYNPYPGTEFFRHIVDSGWHIPESNEAWAKYNRMISADEAGFNISQKHIDVLKKYDLI